MSSNQLLSLKWKEAFELAEQLLSANSGRNHEDMKKALDYHFKCIRIYQSIQECFDMLVHPQKRKLARNLMVAITAELETSFLALMAKGIGGNEYNELLMTNVLLIDDLKLIPSEALLTEAKDRIKTLQSQVDPSKFLEFVQDILPPPQPAPTQPAAAPAIPPPADPLAVPASIPPVVDPAVSGLAGLSPNPLQPVPVPVVINPPIEAPSLPPADTLDFSFNRQLVTPGQTTVKINKKPIQHHEDDRAAIIIQAAYRGYRDRKKKASDYRKEDLIFLNMVSENIDKQLPDLRKSVLQTRVDRVAVQKKNEEEFAKAIVNEREIIKLTDEPIFKQQLSIQFRDWYAQMKQRSGSYPELPPKEQFMEEKFSFIALMQPQSAQGNSNGKDAKKGAKAPAPAAAKGKKGADATPIPVELPPELKRLEKVVKEYQTEWKNLDESENFHQGYDIRILKDQLIKEMQNKTKNEIYDVFAEELQNIKSQDSGGKGGAAKKGKEKEPKAGKSKVEDLTLLSVTDIQALHTNLSKYGILRKITRKFDSDEIASIIDKIDGNLWRPGFPKWAQVNMDQVIHQLFVLPLLTDDVTFDGYQRVVSGLFIGDLNIYDVASYIALKSNANIIDISPVALVKAKQLTNEEPIPLLALAFKTARTTPPSILVIRNPELIFAKKSPITDFDIKAYKKELTKQIKLIKPTERVMILGVATDPSEADAAGMSGSFDFTYYCPPPDYGQRFETIQTRSKGTIGEISSILASLSANGGGITRPIITDVTHQFMNSNKPKVESGEFLKFIDPILKFSKNPNLEGWLSKLAPIGGSDVAAVEATPAPPAGKGKK